MFHQSIRYFRPGKPAIIRFSINARADEWHMGRPVTRKLPDNAGSLVAQQNILSLGKTVLSATETREREAKGDWPSRGTPDFSPGPARGVDPTDRLPRTMATFGKAKDQPPSLVPPIQRVPKARNTGPTPPATPVSATNVGPYTSKLSKTQPVSGAVDPFTSGTRRPGLDAGLQVSVVTTAIPAATPVGTIHRRPAAKVSVHRISSSEAAFSPRDPGHAKDEGACTVNAVPKFGVDDSETNINVLAAADKRQFPGISSLAANASHHNGPDSVSLEAKDLGCSAAHQPTDSKTTDHSANLTGELWIDTLSLREWLQAYLSTEMGHALQSVNRLGTSFD